MIPSTVPKTRSASRRAASGDMPALDVLLDEHVEVIAQLGVELALEALAPEEGAEPDGEVAEHGDG